MAQSLSIVSLELKKYKICHYLQQRKGLFTRQPIEEMREQISSPWRWGVLSVYGTKLNVGKVTGDKKQVRWSLFCADATKPQTSSWAPCSENVASVWSEDGVWALWHQKVTMWHSMTLTHGHGGSGDLTSLNQLELKLDTADSKFLNSALPTSFC